jgi:hypothetical protein
LKPNKLTIQADLPEKRTYEYIFDDLGNPKEINSYVVEADKTWLHKKQPLKFYILSNYWSLNFPKPTHKKMI